MLPAAYQVDHTVPLCDGGADDISNCSAMCPNCHATKTQLEGIERRKASISVAALYADREDVFINAGRQVKCQMCKRVRNANVEHAYCTSVETRGADTLRFALARFAFKPRAGVNRL